MNPFLKFRTYFVKNKMATPIPVDLELRRMRAEELHMLIGMV